MKRPWLLPALGFAGGILVIEAVPQWAPVLAILAGFGFVLTRWQSWPALSLLIGWGFAGSLAWWSERTSLGPWDLRLAAADPALECEIRGVVVEPPTLRLSERRGQTQARTTVSLRVDSWREPGQEWQPIRGQVLAVTRGACPREIFDGAPVEMSGILRLPPGPLAPGLFDYRAHLRFRGISHLLEVESFLEWRVRTDRSVSQPWSARFLPWAQRALAEGLPDTESTRLLWAMTLGWKTALTDEVGSAFVEAGTMHVFAISGLHIALLAGVMVALLRLCRVSRAWCGVAVVPTTWLYVLATGWQPSAVRSAVMMSVVVGGWMLRRPGEVLNSLALAALLILVAYPGELFQPGFQLSFAAVAGLGLWVTDWSPVVQGWLVPARDPFLLESRQPKWRKSVETVLRWLAQSLAVSGVALTATLPFVLHYFHVFSPISLVANVVVVPLSGLALAANVGALLTFGWFPDLAGLFNASAWLWMTVMTGLSRWFAGIPGGVWYVAGPPKVWWLAYYALLTVPAWGLGPISFGRRQKWAVFVGVLVVAWVGGLAARRGVTLQILPGGVVVVDGPGTAQDLVLNSGGTVQATRVLLPWLRAEGWNRVARFGVTQADVAHAGGASNLLARLKPQEVVTGPTRQRSPAFRELLGCAERSGIPHRELTRGSRLGNWQVLSPAAGDKFSTARDNGLVLLGDLEGLRVLILPELGPAGRERLLERSAPELGDVDIVLAEVTRQNAPGLRSLLERVGPQLVLLMPAGSGRESGPSPSRLVGRNPLEMVVLEATAMPAVRLHQGRAEVITAEGVRLQFRGRRQP